MTFEGSMSVLWGLFEGKSQPFKIYKALITFLKGNFLQYTKS